MLLFCRLVKNKDGTGVISESHVTTPLTVPWQTALFKATVFLG